MPETLGGRGPGWLGRRARLIALAVVVAIGVNVAAVLVLDDPSADRRRTAAERDLRARLARRGVRDARVTCVSGQQCTIVLPDGTAQTVDPRQQLP